MLLFFLTVVWFIAEPIVLVSANCEHPDDPKECPVFVEKSESSVIPGCYKGKCGNRRFTSIIDYVGLEDCSPKERPEQKTAWGVHDYIDKGPCYCRFRAVLKLLTLRTCELGEQCATCGEETKPCHCDEEAQAECACDGSLTHMTEHDAIEDEDGNHFDDISQLIFEKDGKHPEGFYNAELLDGCRDCKCECDKEGECTCGCDCVSKIGCQKFVPSKYPMTVTTYQFHRQCCIFFENGYNTVHQDCSSYVRVTKRITVLVNKPEPCDKDQWEPTEACKKPPRPPLGDCTWYNDPHYRGFYKARYDFHGHQWHDIVTLCNNITGVEPFRVYGQNWPCRRAGHITCVGSVNVEFGGHLIEINIKHGQQTVDGSHKDLTSTPIELDGIKIWKIGGCVYVRFSVHPSVEFTVWSCLTRAGVTPAFLPGDNQIAEQFEDNFCGICGNTTLPTNPPSTCKDPELSNAQKICGVILDPTGIFRGCQGMPGLQTYYDNCVVDECEAQMPCTTVKMLVEECLAWTEDPDDEIIGWEDHFKCGHNDDFCSECACWNDPHCRNFEGKHFNFHDLILHDVVKPCDTIKYTGPEFGVKAMNRQCRPGNDKYIGVSCVDYVYVTAYGLEITLNKRTEKYVVNDGLNVMDEDLPYESDNGLLKIFQGPDGVVQLETDFGLTVKVEHNRFGVSLREDLARALRGMECGICGHHNYTIDPPVPCENETDLAKAKAVCAIILDVKGPFAKCSGLEHFNVYYENCLTDVCYADMICANLAELESQCLIHSFPVGDWRKPTKCHSDGINVCGFSDDPHYYPHGHATYFDYHELDEHLLASLCNPVDGIPAFQVTGQNEKCWPPHDQVNNRAACVVHVNIVLNGLTIKLNRQYDKYYVNDTRIFPTYTAADGSFELTEQGDCTYLATDFGLTIRVCGRRIIGTHSISGWIKAHVFMTDALAQAAVDNYCGLCGESDIIIPPLPECPPEKLEAAEAYCTALFDGADAPFFPCRRIPNYDQFKASCLVDHCNTGIACGILEMMAGKCADAGYTVETEAWMEFGNCNTGGISTCRIISFAMVYYNKDYGQIEYHKEDEHVIARLCSPVNGIPAFKIMGQNELCGGNHACIVHINLHVNGQIIKLNTQLHEYFLNDVQIFPDPAYTAADNSFELRDENGCTYLTTDFGLSIRACGRRGPIIGNPWMMRAFITMSNELAQAAADNYCGLCGLHDIVIDDPPECPPEKLEVAEAYCNALFDGVDAAFLPCRKLPGYDKFKESCIEEHCGAGMACGTLETMAEECAEAGYIVQAEQWQKLGGCEDFPITGSCHWWNDPHYRNFYGQRFDFHKTHEHVIAEPCNGGEEVVPYFQLKGENYFCRGNRVACVGWVRAQIDGHSIEVNYRQNIFRLDGVPFPSYGTAPDSDWTPVPSTNLMGKVENGCGFLRTSYGLTFRMCPGRGSLHMTEELAQKLDGKICGLCGEHDEDTDEGPVCDPEENPTRTLPEAEEECDSFLNPENPFHTCLQNLDSAATFLADCQTDMCHGEHVACAALEQLEEDCKAAGQLVGEWRGDIVTCTNYNSPAKLRCFQCTGFSIPGHRDLEDYFHQELGQARPWDYDLDYSELLLFPRPIDKRCVDVSDHKDLALKECDTFCLSLTATGNLENYGGPGIEKEDYWTQDRIRMASGRGAARTCFSDLGGDTVPELHNLVMNITQHLKVQPHIPQQRFCAKVHGSFMGVAGEIQLCGCATDYCNDDEPLILDAAPPIQKTTDEDFRGKCPPPANRYYDDGSCHQWHSMSCLNSDDCSYGDGGDYECCSDSYREQYCQRVSYYQKQPFHVFNCTDASFTNDQIKAHYDAMIADRRSNNHHDPDFYIPPNSATCNTNPLATGDVCHGFGFSLRVTANLTGYNGYQLISNITAGEHLSLPFNMTTISDAGSGDVIYRGCWQNWDSLGYKWPRTEGCINGDAEFYDATLDAQLCLSNKQGYGNGVVGIPINGGWSPWTLSTSQDGDCSADPLNQAKHVRECNNPSPQHGGDLCLDEAGNRVLMEEKWEDCMLVTTCEVDQFKCNNDEKCIPIVNQCDGNSDCWDKSDEENCVARCNPKYQKRCANGNCVGLSVVCDGNNECGDNSDEENCGDYACLPQQSKCKDGLECFDTECRCNGYANCNDGSDEEGCNTDMNPSTNEPVSEPTEAPTEAPSEAPSEAPTDDASEAPTEAPSDDASEPPSEAPSEGPTEAPTEPPTEPSTAAPAP